MMCNRIAYEEIWSIGLLLEIVMENIYQFIQHTFCKIIHLVNELNIDQQLHALKKGLKKLLNHLVSIWMSKVHLFYSLIKVWKCEKQI